MKRFLQKKSKFFCVRQYRADFSCCGGCPAVAMADNHDYLGIDEEVCYLHKNRIDDKIREILSEKGII